MSMLIVYPLPKIFPISQYFGEDRMVYGPLGHPGIDFPCPVGTEVYGTAGFATVVQEEWEKDTLPSYRRNRGRYVGIDTNDGDLYLVYAHLDSILVKRGDVITNGQLIGFSGNTGMLTTGPHLHFGVYNGWIQPLDPLSILLVVPT